MNDTPIEDILPDPSGSRTWSVIHTRPRCEKKSAEYCRAKGCVAYLPQLTRVHRYGKRTRTYLVPLFAGYIFVLADDAGRQLVRGSNFTANLLLVHDQNTLLRQLRQVHFALSSMATVELLPNYTTGMTVQVKSGPLKGLEGIIEKVKNRTRILLNVDFIQQSIAVELDADQLLPV